MYTDDDLNTAVKEGIFDQSSVNQFRQRIAAINGTKAVDEENFRLISGFNDVFVSLSAVILMISAGWVCYSIEPVLAFIVVAGLSWGLSVFFINRRRLALPAILFLMSFVFSCAASVFSLMPHDESSKNMAIISAFSAGVIAAFAHWKVFRVPITVAAGMACLVGLAVGLLTEIDALKDFTSGFILVGGLCTFVVAMMWDLKDPKRITQKSDVAFWLHLIASPMIVHPTFQLLGVIKGDLDASSIAIVLVLYVLMALVSIVIDRRALMVSSLAYVLYALQEVFNSTGLEAESLAVSGVFIGSMLLILSLYWHKTRVCILNVMPAKWQLHLPALT
jgi:hypothetical protein